MTRESLDSQFKLSSNSRSATSLSGVGTRGFVASSLVASIIIPGLPESTDLLPLDGLEGKAGESLLEPDWIPSEVSGL